MGRQVYMRLGILGLLAAMAVPQHLCAQFLSCSEGQSQISHPVQYIKITIADVEFSGTSHLTDDARTQLVNRIKSLDLEFFSQVGPTSSGQGPTTGNIR